MENEGFMIGKILAPKVSEFVTKRIRNWITGCKVDIKECKCDVAPGMSSVHLDLNLSGPTGEILKFVAKFM